MFLYSLYMCTPHMIPSSNCACMSFCICTSVPIDVIHYIMKVAKMSASVPMIWLVSTDCSREFILFHMHTYCSISCCSNALVDIVEVSITKAKFSSAYE